MRPSRFTKVDMARTVRGALGSMRADSLGVPNLCVLTGLSRAHVYTLLSPGGLSVFLRDVERKHWQAMLAHGLATLQRASRAPLDQRQLLLVRHVTQGKRPESAAHVAISAMDGCEEREEWCRLVAVLAEEMLEIPRPAAAALAGALTGALLGFAREAEGGDTAARLEAPLTSLCRALGRMR